MSVLTGNFGVAVSYWLLAYGTFTFLSAFGAFPAPFWPSASIALAAALAGGPRLWPGIFLGSFGANWLLFGAAPPVAALISVANVVAPALGAILIRRTTGTTLPFFQIPHVVAFVLFGTVLHGMLAASGGVGVAFLTGTVTQTDAFAQWARWTLSDAGGTFLFGPALLLWWRDRRIDLTRAQWIQGTLIVALTLALTAALFIGVRDSTHSYAGLPYLLIVPLIWLTVRCSVRAGTTLLSLVALTAIGGTIAGSGPFHLVGVERPLLTVGLMVVAMGSAILAVGALVSERRGVESRLRDLNRTLEARIAERTAELHRRATQDGLTGLANRTHFFELGEQALVAARARGESMAALIIDLDRLKEINDTFGHSAGDEAIVALASTCRSCVRRDDVLGRIGGDEFAVLLPGKGATEAQALVNRIHARLESAPGGGIRASIGWAELLEEDVSVDDVLARADVAMYSRKRQRGGTPEDQARFRTT